MKVKALIESEWDGEKETFGNPNQLVDRLFRVQAARCHELVLFYDSLLHQIGGSLKLPGGRAFTDLRYWHSTNSTFLVECFPSQRELPATKKRHALKAMFMAKYKRMMVAKQRFESAGGSYREEREKRDQD